ncbi:hypothetical protein BS47DRAFT_1346487 [Hydnum rufescens UP504]|uniref:Uncharacterized protein n=1 Tax=Hydnum rufescens UP504 TaxID=1448309 RepID=A0A9P6DUE7_9AGAM|nr:hypothetical protein BS47DRAFT_1346487 [Hydnum rufescens UP504]
MGVLKHASSMLDSSGPPSCCTGTDRNESIVQIISNGESARFDFELQGYLSAIVFRPWSHMRPTY